MYQLLLLLFNVRNDGCGLIESSSTEAMSASPLPAQEGRVVGWVAGGRGQAGAGGLWEQDKRGTEAQVDSTITFAIAVRRAHQQAASETRPSQQDTHARLLERHYQRRNRGPGREHVVARDCRSLHRPPRRSPCKEARERGVGPGAGAASRRVIVVGLLRSIRLGYLSESRAVRDGDWDCSGVVVGLVVLDKISYSRICIE